MSIIYLKDIMVLENLTEYKLHTARWSGENQPLDVYVNKFEDWVNWNKWQSTKNEFNRKYIFSLINYYHETNTWLFGGVFEVIGRKNKPKSFSYDIEEIESFNKYVGRLKVQLKISRGRAFLFENFINKIQVSEILKIPYKGEEFPGYENINHDFSLLQSIFKYENPGWKSALLNIKGVYLICDKSNGKKYIGSAYGGDGIWSRWSCYMGTGHGWNDELTKLIKKEGIEYAIENFKMSLLEYRPMKTDDITIIERENYWKEALLSRKFGYNKN